MEMSSTGIGPSWFRSCDGETASRSRKPDQSTRFSSRPNETRHPESGSRVHPLDEVRAALQRIEARKFEPAFSEQQIGGKRLAAVPWAALHPLPEAADRNGSTDEGVPRRRVTVGPRGIESSFLPGCDRRANLCRLTAGDDEFHLPVALPALGSH
jgi:hypothetical protein